MFSSILPSISMNSFGDYLVSAHHPLFKFDGGLQLAYISDDELAQTDLAVFQAKKSC